MILISEDVWGPAFAELATKHPVKQDPDLWNKVDDLKKELATATALVVRNRTQVTAELLDAAPLLKVIARAGVGLDNIDIKAADSRGIVVVAGVRRGHEVGAVGVCYATVVVAASLVCVFVRVWEFGAVLTTRDVHGSNPGSTRDAFSQSDQPGLAGNPI